MSERISSVAGEINPIVLAQPTLAFLHDYWNAKRGARAMPARSDLVPSELRDHLGWIVLVDVQPDFRDFRYRLIGTLVSQYFYADSTGKTIREAFVQSPEPVVNAVIAVHRKCARDKVIVRSYGQSDWMGHGFEAFDSLYMPLSDDGETCNVILSAFVFDKSKMFLNREITRTTGHRPDVPPGRAA